MKTQHTPGPWKDTLPRNAVHPVVRATNKEQTVIAWVQYPADAPLVAAAPSLLEAAQYALDNLDTMTRAHEIKSSKANMAQLGETIKNLQDAIRQANGET